MLKLLFSLLTIFVISFLSPINGQRQFPIDFKFGSASASYQVEGAWNVSGKGENIWDRLTHTQPDKIADGSNGDIAADSYNKYKEDVQMLKAAGMDFYRFSISWSRILPNGDTSFPNEPGLQYYDNLINELLENDIVPMVTMFHWDLPQPLQELGGMANPEIIEYFEHYADVLFARYGNRVKIWNTFNEPSIICENGYGNADRAPLINSPGIGNYICAYNLLVANARVYNLYKRNYAATQEGRLGIVINCGFAIPNDPQNPADVEAADRAMQFYCGQYFHPILSEAGGWPTVMSDLIDARSREEGRAWSRLPTMTDAIKEEIKGTTDFIGLNYYSSDIVQGGGTFNGATSFWNDREVVAWQDQSWPVAKSVWLRSYPPGLSGILNWIRTNYDNPEVMITENGWSDGEEVGVQDIGRQTYLKDHLNAVLDAIDDGCRVTAHTTWSIMDNFEWMMGYTERFGIYHVDFNDPNRARTPKNSVAMLREIIQTRVVPP